MIWVKRAARLINGGKYALPGGYVEAHERIVDGARRELLEETGYSAKDLYLFAINDHPNRLQEDRQNVDYIFVCSAEERIGEPDNESELVEFFPLSNLPPKETTAFDHYEMVQKWLKHCDEPVSLPLFDINY
jgi:ADP-ribose pyrophosphatase YjhB (NUDIX family)